MYIGTGMLIFVAFVLWLSMRAERRAGWEDAMAEREADPAPVRTAEEARRAWYRRLADAARTDPTLPDDYKAWIEGKARP